MKKYLFKSAYLKDFKISFIEEHISKNVKIILFVYATDAYNKIEIKYNTKDKIK